MDEKDKKPRKSRGFGDPLISRLLKTARIAAGFKSANAAALAHGWSESTYRAQESGDRRIQAGDAQRYSSAFGIEPNGLLDREQARFQFERLTASGNKFLSSDVGERNQDVGRRLRTARIARGYSQLSSACARFGFARATAAAHEDGENAVSDRMAEAYAAAYGISSSWLLHGLLPSGMGRRADALLANSSPGTPPDPHQLEILVDPAPTPDFNLIEQLRSAATAKPAPSKADGDYVSEAMPKEFSASGSLSSDRAEQSRYWRLPKGLLSQLFGAAPDDVAVLTVDYPHDGLNLGDRVFVDRSRRDLSHGGEFAFSNPSGQLHVRSVGPGSRAEHYLDRDGILLGRVIAKFTRSMFDY